MKASTITGLLVLVFVMFGCHEESPSTDPVASVIKLDIVSGTEVYLGGDQIALSEIENALKALADQLDVYLVYEVAPENPAPIYLDVMQQIRNAGITGISSAESQVEGRSVQFYKPVLNS